MRSRKRNDGNPRDDAESKAPSAAAYPPILREYASSGFRDGGVRRRTSSEPRPFAAYRRTGLYRDHQRQKQVEAEDAPERYGEGGPYWQRKG